MSQKFMGKSKEVLQMSKDGAVVKSLADNTEKRVSDREKDMDYRKEKSANLPPYVPSSRVLTGREYRGEYSHSNIRRQRRQDVLAEKKEANLDKGLSESSALKNDSIASKKRLYAERSNIIKSEYGSIENYNIAKKSEDFTKSQRLKDVESRYSELGGKIRTESSKIKSYSAEKDEITARRNSLKSVRTTDRMKAEGYKSKLQFAKEKGDRLEINAAKADYKLAQSQRKLPQQKALRRSYAFDEKSGKVKSRLIFENEIKPVDGNGGMVAKAVKGGVGAVSTAAAVGIHRQVSKYEDENQTLKAAHGAEKVAETSARVSVRTVKTMNTKLKEEPYKRASKLRFQSEKANSKLSFQRNANQNKQTVKSAMEANKANQKAVRKSMQKKAMRNNAQKLQKSVGNKAKETLIKVVRKIQMIVTKNITVVLIVIAAVILLAVLASLAGSVIMMLGEATGGEMLSSYMSEDDDIYAANDSLTDLENELQSKIDNIESEYPNYDEYRVNADTIGHEPHDLIAYLSALLPGFEFDTETQNAITELFDLMYKLEITSTSEQRIAYYTVYDQYGNPYLASYVYTYNILEVTLTANDFDEVVRSLLNDDEWELYQSLQETKGNREDLF